MSTFEEPHHCPKCQSKNISLGQRVYKKDVWGEDTDIVISGRYCKIGGDINAKCSY